MTNATYQADGAMPFGTNLRLAPRFLAELIAAGQVLAVAVAALSLAVVAHRDARPLQSAEPAYRSTLEGPISLTVPQAAPEDGRRVLQDLLTKAGLRPHFDVHRLSWTQARQINAMMPVAPAASDAAKPFLLAVHTKEGGEALHCLTQAAYYEAGASGADAQAAVVQVVLNRVRHPNFPKSVCGVVYQGAERQTGCQFSFTCDGSLQRRPDAAEWRQAETVATRALSGHVVPAVGASTYYHADYVFPVWAPELVKTATVGPHIFYRMSGFAGETAALTGHYAGGELKVSQAILAAADRVSRTAMAHVAARPIRIETAPAAPVGPVGPMDRIRMRIAAIQAAPPAEAKPEAAPTPVAPVASTESASPAA